MIELNRKEVRGFLYNAIILLIILNGCNTQKTEVDKIISASRIYTSDSNFNIVECMAIHKGKVVATGTNKEIHSQYSSLDDEAIEGYVYPGFIDAHSHFLNYGIMLSKADLKNTFSMEEVVNRVVEYSRTTSEVWIQGRGWDETDWTTISMPNNIMLSAYFPDRPVFISRVDGHAAIANAKALELAGITPETKVEGGEIEVIGGRLSGLVTDRAMDLVRDVIPPISKQSRITALLKAQEMCFDAGLTTVTDAGLDLETILTIDSLHKSGDLSIRLYVMCNPTKENFEYFKKNGAISTDLLQVSSFKLYADGALGSRGAKLKKSYCDHENYTGVWVTSPQTIDSFCNLLSEMNFQVNTHCIGDSANRKTLETYGNYLKGENDKRWRIEHAQVVTPEDRTLFRKYSIIPSVQPTHATSDMNWAEERICNNRLDGAYAYKSLLALNNYIPLGTDFPVENISPIETFHSAVYRQDVNRQPVGGFLPSEALSPQETILGMTRWAAKANFMEDRVGSLETGKIADFIILNTDIYHEKYMLNTLVKATYVSGVKK
jgi:predicted amidohydrolase YtcJ